MSGEMLTTCDMFMYGYAATLEKPKPNIALGFRLVVTHVCRMYINTVQIDLGIKFECMPSSSRFQRVYGARKQSSRDPWGGLCDWRWCGLQTICISEDTAAQFDYKDSTAAVCTFRQTWAHRNWVWSSCCSSSLWDKPMTWMQKAIRWSLQVHISKCREVK